MRFTLITACCLLLACGFGYAQSTRGSITGHIVDPAGAVIPNASLEAVNTDTGAKYQVASSDTGNYTLAELPAGLYQLSTSVSGFKQYLRTGIIVMGSQTLRIDIALEVGNLQDTVTVESDATLLRTETGELSHNVSTKKLDDLPVVGFNQWVRDPLAAGRLVPGTNVQQMAIFRVNGAPNFTQSMRVEGMEANNAVSIGITKDSQPSVDALEEVTVLTSNYAAEYGQAGGGIVNMTTKSGTNNYHGSAYLYWNHEKLNSAQPYTGAKAKSRVFVPGFNVGGPVYIPKIFDGHNKMFFFVNYEASRRTQMVNTSWTMPTDKMRAGDFSEAYTGRKLGTDDWGRPLMEGQIYDPFTKVTVVNGKAGYRDMFLNNQIPTTLFDPVAQKIQEKFIPVATNKTPGLLTNNYYDPWPYPGHQNVPSAKLDWYIGSRTKISAYGASFEGVARGGDDGIKTPLTNFRPTNTNSKTLRASVDQTLSPTKLLHFQIGFHGSVWPDYVLPEFDQVKELGLTGAYSKRFPALYNTASGTRGGLGTRLGASGGPTTQSESHMERPEAAASFTWVKSNHTYKFGAEMRLDGFPTIMLDNSYGVYMFDTSQTGLPSTYGTTQLGGGSIGFAYASFMLGLVNSGNIGIPSAVRQGKQSWAFYAQDSWKVTRKLTFDYGLRYDYQTYLRDTYGRIPSFDPNTPNPKADGILGAVIYERNGTRFASNYPFAFGPRLGIAYQVLPQTVIRAGVGITYGQTANENRTSLGNGSSTPFSAATGSGAAIMQLKNGPPAPGQWPNYDAGLFVTAYGNAQAVSAVDRNAGRPPRQIQWSLSIQREIFKNFAVEIAYVGNRGAWWVNGNLININALTPEMLLAKGFDITQKADRDFLTTTMKASVGKRGITMPYSGFAMNQLVIQSLRPYPQYGTITYRWAPLGRTWYDALQAKATKRFSKGFDFTAAFTWAKELMMGSENESGGNGGGVTNNVFDRKQNKYLSSFSRPIVFMAAGNYRLPKLAIYKPLSLAIRDWTIGMMVQYASGTPIAAPAAQNSLATYTFMGTYANRVPGQSLWTKDINCTTCFDPNKDFVLNPAAWSDPAPGTFGTGAIYYGDYRSKRFPTENMSLERKFRFRESMSFSLRIDFSNIFNRINVPGPSSGNALSTQTRNTATGKPTGGFGYINTANPSGARQGQAVLKFQF
jgi:hypothetical protein